MKTVHSLPASGYLTTIRVAAAAVLMAASALAHADSWDAVAQFSSIYNSNGNWYYMFRTPGGSAENMSFSEVNCRGLRGLTCWNIDAGSFDLPMIGINTLTAPINFGSGEIPLGTLTLHPGASNEQAILRFKVLDPGTYRFVGHFQMVDKTPTGVTVSVEVSPGIANVPSLGKALSRVLTKFGEAAVFSIERTLVSQQTVDFVVDSNLDYANDTTEVKVGVLRIR